METWYVCEDGSAAEPRDVKPDSNGRLRHKDGRAVAYRLDGKTPRSRGVDAVAERMKAKPAREAASPEDREMKPKGRKGYRTR